MPETQIFIGKKDHKARNRGIFVVLLAVLAVAAFFTMPVFFDVPCSVTLNGTVVKASTQMSVITLVDRYKPELKEKGNLVSVAGDVIKEHKGKSFTLKRNGQIVEGNETVRSGDSVDVIKGKDVREGVVTKIHYIDPGFKRMGNGPMTLVVDAGMVGQRETKKGEISGVEFESTQTVAPRKLTVKYGNPSALRPKVIALTFDDGPNPGETEAILTILRDQGVKATFFMLGKNVDKHPELAKRVADEGHQIASHSYSHTPFTKLSYPKIKEEAARSRAAIKEATGVDVKWMRPPYGMVNGMVFNILADAGIRGALWTLEPRDWSRPGKQAIINRVIFNRHPGAVVLFHDGGGNRTDTVKALPGIIGELRDKGYTFVTIEQLDTLMVNAGLY